MMVAQAFRGMVRLAALAALALFPFTAAQGQTPQYSVTNLGTVVKSSETDTVIAISSDGSKVVGYASYPSGKYGGTTAFYWDGSMHNAGTMSSEYGGILADTTPLAVTPTGLVLLGAAQPTVWTLIGGKVSLPIPVGLEQANAIVGVMGAWAMNDNGTVVGGCENQLLGFDFTGTARYTRSGLRWSLNGNVWTPTLLAPLVSLGHNSSNVAYSPNAVDQMGNVVGYSWKVSLDATGHQVFTDYHAVLWDSSLAPHDLGILGQGQSTQPVDARTTVDSQGNWLQTLFVWNLGSQANYSFANNGTATVTTNLFGSGATSPSAETISLSVGQVAGVNVGQVAGNANFAGGSHAFYWDTSFPSGAVMDLGVLTGMTNSVLVRSTLSSKRLNHIDDNGFIVGTSSGSTSKAFLSTPASRATSAKLLDLNTLLTTNALKNAGIATLIQGQIINNTGFIACHGTDTKGYQRVVRLKREQ